MKEAREASDVIRAFYCQIAVCTLRWVEAEPGATVVTEGMEDIDYQVLKDNSLSIRTENIKDLAGRISARTPAVYEAIAHFAKNFLSVREKGNTTFVFTTTAGLARQNLNSQTQNLHLDILQHWLNIVKRSEGCHEDLVTDVKNLLYSYVISDSRQSKRFRDETRDAVAAISSGDLWREFLSSVEWNFSVPGIDETMGQLTEILRAMQCNKMRGGHIRRFAPFIANDLFLHVLRRSTRPTLAERTLTKDNLDSCISERVSTYVELGDKLEGIKLISWVNWRKQSLLAAYSPSGQTVVGLFISQSDSLGEEWRAASAKLKGSPFVGPEAKSLFDSKKFFCAALKESVVGSELCDLILGSSAVFFIGFVPETTSSAQVLRRVTRARLRANRLEVVTATAQDLTWLRESGIDDETVLDEENSGCEIAQFIAEVFEHAILDRKPPTPMAHVLYPRVKLIIDKAGTAHRQGSNLLVGLFERVGD